MKKNKRIIFINVANFDNENRFFSEETQFGDVVKEFLNYEIDQTPPAIGQLSDLFFKQTLERYEIQNQKWKELLFLLDKAQTNRKDFFYDHSYIDEFLYQNCYLKNSFLKKLKIKESFSCDCFIPKNSNGRLLLDFLELCCFNFKLTDIHYFQKNNIAYYLDPFAQPKEEIENYKENAFEKLEKEALTFQNLIRIEDFTALIPKNKK